MSGDNRKQWEQKKKELVYDREEIDKKIKENTESIEKIKKEGNETISKIKKDADEKINNLSLANGELFLKGKVIEGRISQLDELINEAKGIVKTEEKPKKE